MTSLAIEYDLARSGAGGELLPATGPDPRGPSRSALRFGFERVRRLRGNIGYLELRGFASVGEAGPTAVAAFALIARTSALVLDLRGNTGGDRAMAALVSSFFFDTEPAYLDEVYWRCRSVEPAAHASPVARYTAKPVYLLTSARTAGVAEEFASNLRRLGRAVLVGERTLGGVVPELEVAAPLALERAHFAVLNRMASTGATAA